MWSAVAGTWIAYTALLALLQFIIYPAVTAPWQLRASGIAAGLVVTAGCLVLARRVVADFHARPWQWLVGIGCVVAGSAVRIVALDLSWAAALAQVSFYVLAVGLPEETLFRGVIWRQLEAVLDRKVWVLLVNSALFGLSHLPALVSQHSPLWILATLSLVGAVFGLVRACGGSIPLLAGIHVGWDLVQF
ncbi:CPBP family intramembrane glutamic endopeptidase [Raineyella antarctica]|uniref:CPBP family intramembrane glutamic endopeptidase n=1 Tax=Raineyella antarctica TaxID=1577474 RepID=UPI0015880C10|nr:CPBP family intramembrane glutamic endopeptidase [Raineyella antarctica]